MLTDNDKTFGPLTWGKTNWKAFQLSLESHGGTDGHEWNKLMLFVPGHAASLSLPRIIRPWRKKVQYQNAETAIAITGRDWYWDEERREYGFSLCDGHFVIHYGVQPGDSTRDQYWSCFLPWAQWRFVRFSLYQPDGSHFYTQHGDGGGFARFHEQHEAREHVGKVTFTIRDHDGEEIIATTHIEEREWRFGTKWCSWMGVFCRPKVVRSLNITYSSEVGPEKGSWKGGTIGHSVTMLDGETPHQAFQRYCEMEHRSKNGRYKVELA